MILCCRKEFLFIKEAGFGGQGGVRGVLLVSSLLQLHLCWAAVKLTMSYWSISSWSHERHVNCWSNCILSNASKSIGQPWRLLIAQMSHLLTHSLGENNYIAHIAHYNSNFQSLCHAAIHSLYLLPWTKTHWVSSRSHPNSQYSTCFMSF